MWDIYLCFDCVYIFSITCLRYLINLFSVREQFEVHMRAADHLVYASIAFAFDTNAVSMRIPRLLMYSQPYIYIYIFNGS